jgi:hypothetical protein
MDLTPEIAKRVGRLPSDLQKRVLNFVASLDTPELTGEKGGALRQFSSSLDAVSARQMTEAIEEECERVDAGAW